MFKKYKGQLVSVASDAKSKFAAGVAGASALLASGASFAAATTPGAAIAGELAGGDSDLMLIIGAVAVLLGILILWAYTKRAR